MFDCETSKAAALNALIHCCHKKHYAAKRTIILPGSPADTLHYIIDGSVSIDMEAEDGQNMILAYLNRGQFIGEAGVFVGSRVHGVTIRTRSECHFAEISHTRLHKMFEGPLAEHAAPILMLLGSHLSYRLIETNRKVEHLAFMDVAERIEQALIDLTKEPDAIHRNDGIQIRITRMEIARIVGCSREMAGRVVNNMVQEGSITAKGMTIVVFGKDEL